MDEIAGLRLAIAEAVTRGGTGVAERVGRVCAAALPGDGGSVSLMTSSAVWETLAATDETATRLDDTQYTLGEGPAWDAFTSGRTVVVRDLNAGYARRWPAFLGGVAGLGVGGVFAFPLQVGAIAIGVCVSYTRGTAGLDAAELRSAYAVTGVAALALIGLRNPATRDGEPRSVVAWLDDASVDRRQVHQATGILIAQLGLSAEAAFARLRGHAFGSGRLVGDVAAEIVAGTLRLDREPP